MMTVTFTPIRSGRNVSYSQPRPDVLAINGDELDMSDTQYVEYDIPPEFRDYVQRAWREDGELHLRLLAHYGPRNALREEKTAQYGIGEVAW